MDAKEFKNFMLENSEKDYGLCPPPLNSQEALKILTKHFLGDDWYVVMPLNQQQVNTEAVYEILRKFPEKKSIKDLLRVKPIH